MKLLRRRFLKLAGVLVAAPAWPRRASAEDHPARPVHIIAGFAAGGGVDMTARLIGRWLSGSSAGPYSPMFREFTTLVFSESRRQGVQRVNERIAAKWQLPSTTASRG